MRHIAEGTRVKKPFKPRPSRAKKSTDWRKMVRLALGKKRGNLNYKKAVAKTSWKNNKDGFMLTSRENKPTKNQLGKLGKRFKKETK